MNAPVKDLYRRQPPRTAAKHRYRDLRDFGMTRERAALTAGIALSYAATLDSQAGGMVALTTDPQPQNDDAYVDALITFGGLPRLSERLGRLGHTVCLPLVPFGGRP